MYQYVFILEGRRQRLRAPGLRHQHVDQFGTDDGRSSSVGSAAAERRVKCFWMPRESPVASVRFGRANYQSLPSSLDYAGHIAPRRNHKTPRAGRDLRSAFDVKVKSSVSSQQARKIRGGSDRRAALREPARRHRHLCYGSAAGLAPREPPCRDGAALPRQTARRLRRSRPSREW